LTNIFFKGVGSTTNKIFTHDRLKKIYPEDLIFSLKNA